MTQKNDRIDAAAIEEIMSDFLDKRNRYAKEYADTNSLLSDGIAIGFGAAAQDLGRALNNGKCCEAEQGAPIAAMTIRPIPLADNSQKEEDTQAGSPEKEGLHEDPDGKGLTDRIRECIAAADGPIRKTYPGVRKVIGLLEEALHTIEAYEKDYDDEQSHDLVYRDCINTYGNENQELVAIEEMSELTKALLKGRREGADEITPEIMQNIIDEIADVKIMVRQLEIIYDAEDDVDERVTFKTTRQAERLSERRKRK